MSFLNKLFNKPAEPASDFDTDYDALYYGNMDGKDEAPAAGGNVENDDLFIDGIDAVAEEEKAEEEKEPIYKATFVPDSYFECRDMVDALVAGRVVLIDVNSLSKADFLRVLDYVSGAVQALDGGFLRLDNDTVALLPPEVVDMEDLDFDSLEEEPIFYDDDEEYEDDIDISDDEFYGENTDAEDLD